MSSPATWCAPYEGDLCFLAVAPTIQAQLSACNPLDTLKTNVCRPCYHTRAAGHK